MDPTVAITPAATGGVEEGASQTIQVGYNSSITGDVAAFEGSLQAAEQADEGCVRAIGFYEQRTS